MNKFHIMIEYTYLIFMSNINVSWVKNKCVSKYLFKILHLINLNSSPKIGHSQSTKWVPSFKWSSWSPEWSTWIPEIDTRCPAMSTLISGYSIWELGTPLGNLSPFFNKMEVLKKPGIHFGKIGHSFRETEYLYFRDYDIVVFYYFTKLIFASEMTARVFHI